MAITVTRDRGAKMKHVVQVRAHQVFADTAVDEGGEDLGLDPHDFYDSALGSCKALTVLWYANRKGIPVEDIQVSVERDRTGEKAGTYRLRTELKVTGDLTDAQRRELLSVAQKCPLHKLMTQLTTEIETVLAE